MAQVPVIVISSPQVGVGKTTLAFNLAGALWHDKYQVQIFSPYAKEFLEKRHNICQIEKLDLPFPRIITNPEEIKQERSAGQVIIADIPTDKNNQYLEIFSNSHTLVTVANKQTDINWQFSDDYLNLVWQTKKNIALKGIKYLNWVVVENHLQEQETDWNDDMQEEARRYGFRISPKLRYRQAYTHINKGYCAADMVISELGKNMTLSDVYARHEILRLTDFMWQK